MDDQLNNKHSNFSFSSTLTIAVIVILIVLLFFCLYFIYSLMKEKTILFHEVNSLKSDLSQQHTLINQNEEQKNNIASLEKNLQNCKSKSIENIWIEPSQIICSENNWNNYHNNEYGFSIQYPNEWKLEENLLDTRPLLEIKTADNVACSGGGPTAPDEGYSVGIFIDKNDDKKTLESIKQAKEKFECNDVAIKNINGKEMLFSGGCPELCGGYPDYIYLDDNYIYTFNSVWWPSEDSFEELFDQIINTVKFE